MILIGSRAANYHDSDFIINEKTDWDVIASIDQAHVFLEKNKKNIVRFTTNDQFNKYGIHYKDNDGKIHKIEMDIMESRESNKILYQADNVRCYPLMFNTIFGLTLPVAPKVFLYLLKKSHIYWPVHWEKNIEHYTLMREKNWNIFNDKEYIGFIKPFLDTRMTEHAERFGKKKINLNMSNDKFFKKSEKFVKRIINHDEIHDAVKYYTKPLYQVIKKDQSKALVNKELFDALSPKAKLRTVKEEAMVIAIERYMLSDKPLTAKEAYYAAYKRICTTLTSGWFREFAINNYRSLRALDDKYDPDLEAIVVGLLN